MASRASKDRKGYIGLISDEHRRSVLAMRGAAGAAWLKRIPGLLEESAARWSLRIGDPVGDLWFNYVTHAERADGSAAILKLCPPDERDFGTEGRALQHFDGRGCVRLLEVDFPSGAMLLEALRPGTPLDALEDEEERIQISAAVMRSLWRPVPPEHDFPSVAYWGTGFQRLLRDRFDGTSGPLPEPLVSRAEALFAELVASQPDHVLLHGDLHWENILAAQREPWLAIDPKGVIGEPAYEVGILLRNHMPASDARAEISRRIDLLAEVLGFDRQRLRAWGFAQAVLSAVWDIDDHGQAPVWSLSIAETLL